MGNQEKSLKAQNARLLWSFVAFQLILFVLVVVTRDTSLGSFEQMWESVTVEKGLAATVVTFLTIILTGIIPSGVKEMLVFWRIKDVLPGHRAFTELAPKEPRVDLRRIKRKHGVLPDDPMEQNRLWYRIYKANEPKVTIRDSQKMFLLTRDLATITFIILILFLGAMLFIPGSIFPKLLYVLFLLVQYVVLAIVARHYGNRFTCNVMAEESVQ